ncbi:hypothetical protein HID58_042459 [Brassica napus]|uniref:Uncharacterized protein n=1 Tax=Brassica napus TaxID=3708 RepID=A0ABQ8BDQ5_BRANA|nr:hypothetical protein HID58_042459 [Brassica napus]
MSLDLSSKHNISSPWTDSFLTHHHHARGFGSIDDREKGFIGGVRDFMDKKITDFIDERIVVCEILL